MRPTTSLLVAGLLGASTVLAKIVCALDKKCPQEAPCCGLYGECGTGAFCLGGCDPRMSFSKEACVPAPVCKSKKYSMSSMDGITDVGKYLGDSKTSDWVVTGEPVIYNNNLLLTMPPRSVGTVLSTTTYMWYGSVSAKIRTGRGAGVVTAFILFSDVKDEIDYEWVGTELGIAQTNYYFQGIPSYVNSANLTLSNTYSNWHTYEVKWTPDEIIWLVDGQEGRRKKRSETWNATANQWDFPQTPARVQLSIWPGGADTNAKGTIDWAGGPIDWNNHEDIKTYGYYYAMIGEIEVKCFDAANAPGTNKGVSYYYRDLRATNDTVVDGDKPTVLKSFAGSGLDMDKGGSSTSSTGGSTPSGTASAAPIASIPGGAAAGPGAGSHSDGTPTTVSPDCISTTFQQTCGGQRNEGVSPSGERILGASAFAVVVALAGVLIL